MEIKTLEEYILNELKQKEQKIETLTQEYEERIRRYQDLCKVQEETIENFKRNFILVERLFKKLDATLYINENCNTIKFRELTEWADGEFFDKILNIANISTAFFKDGDVIKLYDR